MRVLAVASSGQLGGAELVLADLLGNPRTAIDPYVLVLGGGPLEDRIGALGVPVRAAPELGSRPTARSALGFTRSLARVIEMVRPELVWAVGIKAAVLSLPAARRRRVPIVWHKVDFSHDRLAAVPLAAACDGVMTVSEAAAAALGPVRERRHLGVAGVPVSLPDGFRARPDPERPVLATLARLVPYKGQDRLLAAAALLRDEFPGVRVLLAGDPAPEAPAYPSELRELAAELGLGDRLEMPGFLPAADALERVTVYVSATHRSPEGYGLEGLGAGVIEAQWAGIPVVAAAGGGIGEAFADGSTGTLVQGAEPSELAAAARRYLADPELARRTGEAGTAFARERFAPDVVAERVAGMLARVARPYGARSPQRSRS